MSGDRNAARQVYQEGGDVAQLYGDAGFFQAYALFELRSAGVMEALRTARQDARRSKQTMEREEVWQRDMGINIRSSDRCDEEPAAHGPIDQSTQETDCLTTVEDYLSPVQLEAQRRARRLFKKAVTVNKRHSASWVSWAKFEQRSGHPEVARKLLVSGIANFPESRNIGWFQCALGHLARQQGDVVTSRACYERAVAATSSYRLLPVLLEFARMEAYHGDVSNARRLYERAVKLFPQAEEAWDNFLQLETRLGNAAVVSPTVAALESRRMAALAEHRDAVVTGQPGLLERVEEEWVFCDPDFDDE